jgi:hypothetical protein
MKQPKGFHLHDHFGAVRSYYEAYCESLNLQLHLTESNDLGKYQTEKSHRVIGGIGLSSIVCVNLQKDDQVVVCSAPSAIAVLVYHAIDTVSRTPATIVESAIDKRAIWFDRYRDPFLAVFVRSEVVAVFTSSKRRHFNRRNSPQRI